MEYKDIINYNKEHYGWWSRYAFHMTDINNAVSILNMGKLYSRLNATKANIMKNDNASKKVIDMTSERIRNDVRFYFRPLTPTQYHNEGYKHPVIRKMTDFDANMPVPVFFIFDLEKLLLDSKTKFSNGGQGGNGNQLLSGVEEFSKLDFDKIYGVGPVSDDIYKYRLAELLYPQEYDITNNLKYIVCRSDVEKLSLINLLRETNLKTLSYYQDKIEVRPRIFNKNGLYLNNIQYYDNKLSIKFMDTGVKDKYAIKYLGYDEANNLEPLKLLIDLEWRNNNRSIQKRSIETSVNYMNPIDLLIKLNIVERATKLKTNIYIEKDLIGALEFDLKESVIL